MMDGVSGNLGDAEGTKDLDEFTKEDSMYENDGAAACYMTHGGAQPTPDGNEWFISALDGIYDLHNFSNVKTTDTFVMTPKIDGLAVEIYVTGLSLEFLQQMKSPKDNTKSLASSELAFKISLRIFNEIRSASKEECNNVTYGNML